MADDGERSLAAQVVATKDLVGEIMLKFGSSKSMINLSVVGKSCLAAKKEPGFGRRFAESHTPAFVGFLVEFKQVLHPDVRMLRLMYPWDSNLEESAVAQRQTIDLGLLAEDNVLCSSAGCVLTAGHGVEANPTKYYISFPSQIPRVYTAVADIMPKIPKGSPYRTKNTYGAFGLMRDEGPSGLSFFVKDWTDFFVCTYGGATISSDEDIYVHVCEHVDGTWMRYISPPIESPACALFHRNPYSVIHGDSLFMMYVVGYIVCLDLVSKKFSKIDLPGGVGDRPRLSWYDYTVCHHRESGIAVVNFLGGRLDTWVLVSANEGGEWMLEASMNLLDSFVPKMPMGIVGRILSRDTDEVGTDDFFSVQVRSACEDARFVLVTLAFDPSLYMVDMGRMKVFNIPRGDSDGSIGRVYPLTEEWPPKM